jgi:hypothetical protein
VIWTPDKAQAFGTWRASNQRAYSYSVDVCLRTPDILEEFDQWYAVQRLLGNRKPNPEDAV